MAFTVTPTSGAGPYVISADVSDSVNINGVDYRATLMHGVSPGSCPTIPNSNFNATQVADLLANGSIPYPTPVPAGSCRIFELTIYRISDNTVIDTSRVAVDNTGV